MTNKFVNTASTAGGDGSTNNTAGATRAYASLQEACDALTAIGTLADSYTISCTGSAADTLPVTQAHLGFVTSATNFVLIQGENRQPKYDTSKYRIELTDGDCIYNNNPSHIRLDGLQCQVTVTTSTGNDYTCFRLATANNSSANIDHRISNCFAKIVVSGGATDNVFGYINSNPVTFTGTCRIWNCVAWGGNAGFSSDGSAWATANLSNFNCTAYGNEFPYIDVQICKNCLGANATGGAGVYVSTGTSGHTNNAADDGSVGGTNARPSVVFSFVNTATGDFHLQTSDVGAKDGGLINPAAGLFFDDIDGETRTGAWDIGADEITRTAGELQFAQSTGGTIATSASTWSLAAPANLEGGGAIIIGIGVASSAVTVSTVTDNTTNVYLKAVARGTPRPVAGAELWYVNRCSSLSTRISITLSATSSGSIGFAHFIGISTNTPLDVTGSSAITANSTSHSAAQVTPSTLKNLVVSFCRLDQSTIGTVTTLGGMTRWISTNVAARTVGQYIIQAAASTVTGSFTTSSGCQHASVIAVFNDTNAIAGGAAGRHRYWSFTMTGVQSAHI